MKQEKWVSGLAVGVVIGFCIAGLQPLRAADSPPTSAQMNTQQLNTLIKEVQEIRRQSEKNNLNWDKMNAQVTKMATDIKNMASRNDFVR